MNSKTIRFSPSELEERRPVWDALSTMYLDTDVSRSREWRIKVLSASPYGLDELNVILRDEVHPICVPNLLHPAGEWTGFDPAWLEQAICRRRHRWVGGLLVKISRILPSGLPKDEWAATCRGIVSLRRRSCASE